MEAGSGALNARTHDQAIGGSHPGPWTLADPKAARQAANTLRRPWGAHGPAPAERWAQRQAVTAAERSAFAATVARLQDEAARAATDSGANASTPLASLSPLPSLAPSVPLAPSPFTVGPV
jgi:hypothetical protein